MAWNLLQELEEGGTLHQQRNLIATINRPGNELIGRSYRHRLVVLGVYHRHEDDSYPIEKLYPLVRYDIKNSPADASKEAGITAIRLMLQDPEILKHLSNKTSKADIARNMRDTVRAAAADATRPVIRSVQRGWRHLWRKWNVPGPVESPEVPKAPAPRTCLSQIIERAGQQRLSFRELQTAIDFLAKDHKKESDVLLKSLPRFFENYHGSVSSEEDFPAARALVTRYMDNGNSFSEIATQIKTRLSQSSNPGQSEESKSEEHVHDLYIGLIISDYRLFEKYLENRSPPAPWPMTVVQGLFSLWLAWTIASTIKNMMGDFTHLLAWNPWKKVEEQSHKLMWILAGLSTSVASLAIGGTIAIIALTTLGVGAMWGLTSMAYKAGKDAWSKTTGSSEEANHIYEVMTKGFEKNDKSIDMLLKEENTYHKLMQNLLFCQHYGFDIRNSHLPSPVKDKLFMLSTIYYYEKYPAWASFINIVATLSGGLITSPPWYIKRQGRQYNLATQSAVSRPERKQEKHKKAEFKKSSAFEREKDKKPLAKPVDHFKEPKKFLLFDHFKTQPQTKFSFQAVIPTDAHKQKIM
jgi:hypothetical protein